MCSYAKRNQLRYVDMKQKKLMLLGGSHYLMPAIEASHKLGVEVLTCDYWSDNFALAYGF